MLTRIIALQEALTKNPRQFALSIGVNYSSFNSVVTGRRQPSLQLVVSIIATYRQVNPYWLLLGEGSMFINGFDEHGHPDGENLKKEAQDMRDEINGLLDRIKNLEGKL